jgi:hypothetical protein
MVGRAIHQHEAPNHVDIALKNLGGNEENPFSPFPHLEGLIPKPQK